jgi:PKHD-type hydroxylase
MNYEWCYFNRYFSKDECEKILTDSKDYPVRSGTIGTTDGFKEVVNSRRSTVRFIDKSDENFKWVFDKLWLLAKSCNSQYFHFDVSILDFVQIAEYNYTNAGQYSEHHDVIWINESHPYHRKLSATIQLSDTSSYAGGDFEFKHLQHINPTEINKSEMRQQGTAIFFPSFISHAVNPVTSGTRYSITAWFEGPKWR